MLYKKGIDWPKWHFRNKWMSRTNRTQWALDDWRSMVAYLRAGIRIEGKGVTPYKPQQQTTNEIVNTRNDMKKTYELIDKGFGEYTLKRAPLVSLCVDGMARYFGCEESEMESVLFLTISDKEFKGSTKEVLKNNAIFINGERNYIMRGTRQEVADSLNTDTIEQVYWVSFEVWNVT